MNELQIVLLVVAILAVGGIYWHVRRRGNQQAVWRDTPTEKQISLFGDDDGLVGAPRKAGSKQEPVLDDARQPALPAGVLAVSLHHVRAEPIPAEDLHPALESAGLHYGEYGYYHKTGPDGANIYSVGAITKPGTLNPDDADQLVTPGLTFYMEVDVLGDRAAAVLEDVLTTAQALGQRFDAELVDTRRRPLSIEGLEALRDRVRSRVLG